MNRYVRPTRADLGMSLSQFKTWLWRHGFHKDRAVFSKWNCDFRRGSRRFRLRYQTTVAVVDVADTNFDRWANSTKETLTLAQFMEQYA